MNNFKLKCKKDYLKIGYNQDIQVNCNIGINNKTEYKTELNKIDTLFLRHDSSPNIMMDLSTISLTQPIYQHIINNYKIPVGIVPTYTIDLLHNKNAIIDDLTSLAETGISFFTLHFTANKHLFTKAKQNRQIHVTSRGGGKILQCMEKHNISENIYIQIIDDIIRIASQYDIAISLGTTFRPASIIDACDSIHLEETMQQLEVCKYLQERNIKVIVENIGHIDIAKLETHSKILNRFNAPIMPLGPIPTDNAIGIDHIASAIGASFSAYWNSAHIINSITPAEHMTGELSINDLINGVKTAKLVAHIINLLKNSNYRKVDEQIYKRRAIMNSCTLKEKNCNRCAQLCPLKL